MASWGLVSQDVRVIALTVGPALNLENLKNTVSAPLRSNVFVAADYGDVSKNARELSKAGLCSW